MAKMSVKKGDLVEVISGKDKGTQAHVLRAFPSEGKVTVEGVAVAKKAQKPTAANQQGGFVEKEAKIDASNVMLVCPKCKKGVRVGYSVLENGTKVRVCKKCGASIED